MNFTMMFAYITSAYWCILCICLFTRAIVTRSNAGSESTEDKDRKTATNPGSELEHNDHDAGQLDDKRPSSTVCHTEPTATDDDMNIDSNADHGGEIAEDRLIPSCPEGPDTLVARHGFTHS
jgi:hypothetical protein